MGLFTRAIALLAVCCYIALATALQHSSTNHQQPARIHVRVERIFPQVSPEQAKEAWLDYQWKRGGGLLGILVIPEKEMDYRRRRIFPVGMQEELLPEAADDDTNESTSNDCCSLRYKVTDLGLFSTELVPDSHEATVTFQVATNNASTKMVWEVDCDAQNRRDLWQAITRFNIEAVSDNLASYLLPPIKYTRTTKLGINLDEFIASKEALANEWVDYVWDSGGGLPVPFLSLDNQRRIYIPPFLVERLISSADGQIEYTVDNPSLFTYQVHTHRGRVRFEPRERNENSPSSSQSFDMIWEVEIRPLNGLGWLVRPFTAAIVSTISRNFKTHLLEPMAKVQLAPPRGKGKAFGEISKTSWLGGVLAAHLEDRRSPVEQTMAMLQPWTWGRSSATDEAGETEEWTTDPTRLQAI